MSKFGEVFFALFLLFIGWIFMADTGQKKLDRACRPVSWMGNIFTSTAEMSFPTTSKGVQDWFGRLDYGCEYMLWRLLYEDSYKAGIAVNGGAPGGAAVPGQQPGNAFPPGGAIPQQAPGNAPPVDPRRPIPPVPASPEQPGAYVPAPTPPPGAQQPNPYGNYTAPPQQPATGYENEDDSE